MIDGTVSYFFPDRDTDKLFIEPDQTIPSRKGMQFPVSYPENSAGKYFVLEMVLGHVSSVFAQFSTSLGYVCSVC